MQKRASILLLSLVGLAAVATLSLVVDWGGSELRIPAPGAREPGGASPGLEPTPIAAEDSEILPAREQSEQRAELAIDDQWGPILRVVDAASGAPIPGARVRLVEYRGARLRAREEARQVRSQYELLPLYGSRRISDELGEVLLPVPVGRLLVSAAAGDLYGVLSLEAEQSDTVELLLVADHSLTIQVIDASGQPVVGVPLGISAQLATRRRTIWSGVSGDRGTVSIEHLQVYLPEGAAMARLYADLLFPQLNPTATSLALAADPSLVQTIIMPPVGSAEIRLQHRDQAPVVSAAQVTCQVFNRGFRAMGILPAQSRASGSKREGAEPILIPFLGLGMQLRAEVQAKPLRFKSERFRGPVFAGERVQLSLKVDASVAVLVGRLVDAQGEVLADRQFEMSLVFDAVVSRHQQVRSDDRGRFEHAAVLGSRRPDALFCELRCDPQGPGLSTRVELPAMQKGQRVDLGDIVLHQPAAYATGRVVDDRGEAVVDHRAWVEKQVPALAAGSAPVWLRDLEMPVVLAEGGAIEVHGEGQGERRLQVVSPSHLRTMPLPLRRGLDFAVVLTRGAVLEGTVLVDSWVAAEAIAVRVQPFAASAATIERVISGRGELRRFIFKTLPSGRLSIELWLRSEQRELFRIAELQADAGQLLQDPRLLEIDLRGRLHRVRIELRNASGQRPRRRGALLLVDAQRADEPRQYYDLSKGAIDVATLRTSLDLWVLVPGFEPQALPRAAGLMPVELVRTTAQRIELKGAALALSSPFSLRISLIPDPPWAFIGKISDAYRQRSIRLDTRPFRSLGLEPRGRVNRLGRYQFRNVSSGRYLVRLQVSKQGIRKPQVIDLPGVVIAAGIRRPLVISVPGDLLSHALEGFK